MLKLKLDKKNYKVFIDYASKTCNCVSLVFEKDEYSNDEYFFQEEYRSISGCIIRKENGIVHPDTGSCFYNADVLFLELDKSVVSLLKQASDIFDWNGTNLPEELCFYRDEKVWLTCVCHEKLLFIYNESFDDLNFFKNKKINFSYEI